MRVMENIEKQGNEQLEILAVQQSVQGQWTKWKDYIQRKLPWRTLLNKNPNLVRFAVGSTYDTLVSEAKRIESLQLINIKQREL